MMDDDLFYFLDRAEAGEKLAEKLLEEPLVTDSASETLLVLSIPRGGVVVGVTAARQLGCAHDVIAVKKIGYPGQGELAVGAVAGRGTDMTVFDTIVLGVVDPGRAVQAIVV